MLKALFILEIFTFLSCLSDYLEKRLDKKAMINFKTVTSQTGQQIITIHMYPISQGVKKRQ